MYEKIAKYGFVRLKNIFTLSLSELISKEDPEDEDAPVLFEFGKKVGQYYQIPNDVLGTKNDIYIHESVKITPKTFIAERGISIFSALDRLSEATIKIGGTDETAIPESAFLELLRKFPNSYELHKYAAARVSAVISSYIKTKEDYEEKYLQYMNRRASIEGANLFELVSNAEIEKYKLLLSKLRKMLASEPSYSEKQWQDEIFQIIRLLYPKYIHVFKEVLVRDTDNMNDRRIDLLLVDSLGSIDIIEIKKPFNKCIVTELKHRDNYIPLRELTGTVMQIEKYIYYLNRWGKVGEKKLTSRYREQLGDGFTIKIINPRAIIIMGRENELSADQRQDFEVIKRKYRNVIDIITYDELLERLETTLRHWQIHR